jgi:hypothetical protein
MGENIEKLYILLSGEVQCYLSREQTMESVHLEYVDQAGSIFGQYAMFTVKNPINYSMKVTKTARFITISRIPIYMLRKKIPKLQKEVIKLIEQVEKIGLPMLDYQAQRQMFNDDGDPIPFNATETFQHCTRKLLKIKRFTSFKHFKISDLLEFMRRAEISGVKERVERAKEMTRTIRPKLRRRLNEVTLDPINRL